MCRFFRLAPRLVVLVGVCVLAPLSPATAQAFPDPGEGAYTWERVGDVPMDANGLDWPDGRQLTAVSGHSTLGVLTSDGPSGVWNESEAPRPANGVIMLSDGTALIGDGPIDRSSDGGLTWTRTCFSTLNNCRGPIYANAFLELPPGHAHAGRVLAGSHLYSDDRGRTWTTASHDGAPNEALRIADFALLPSGRVLAAAAGWGLLASDDGGASWQVSRVYEPYRYSGYGITALATPGSVQSGQPSCSLADPALCEGAVAIGTDAQDFFSRVWWTNDGGRSWTQGTPLEQLYDGVGWTFVGGLFDLGLDAETGLGRSVAVLGRGFVFATRDGGQTWAVVARIPVPEPDADGKYVPSALVSPDGRLYASLTYNGPAREWVYRTQEPVGAAFAVAGEASPVEAPRVSVSVRPNPAGGRVEVVVSLASAQAARVVVLDALGREVAVVLDGAAVGEQVVGVDTSSWPAGVYVVRATAGTTVASARLVVAR